MSFAKKVFMNAMLRQILFKRGRIHIIFVVAVFACLLNTSIPLATGKFINSITEHKNLYYALLLLLVFSLGAILMEFFLRKIAVKYSRIFELSLQKRMLDEFSQFNPGKLNEFKHGELTAKFLRDASTLSIIVKELSVVFSFAVIGMLYSTVIVFWKNWYVGLVFLSSIPLCACIIMPFGDKIRKTNHAYRRENDQALNRIYDFVVNFPYLKSLSAVSPLDYHIKNNFSILNQTGQSLDQTNLLFEMTIRVLLFLGEYGILVTGGYLAWHGRISIGDVVMFQMLFMQALGALSGIFRIMPWVGMVEESVDSIDELSEFGGKENDHGKVKLKNFSGRIRCEHISYCYPDQQTAVIHDFSYLFRPGECTVITGANGVGKTTLTKLLTAYMEPTEGKIFFDDIELHELDRTKLREEISILFQDSVLLSGTIRENITLGQPYSEEELQRVITLCGLDDVVKKSADGLETELQAGTTLSGGERQRVALARALIRRPKLAIFDEISNHMDSKGITLLFSLLNELKKTCAVIVISHDTAIISHGDRTIDMTEQKFYQNIEGFRK